MATSFRGWGQAWLDSWGPSDPSPPTGFIVGSAAFSITAALQVNSGEMQGNASFRIDAILGVGEPRYSQEVTLKRRWYVKRRKQVYIFDTAEEADQFIAADDAAEKAIKEAQKTSKQAKKRVRQKVYEAQGLEPESVSIDWVAHLVSLYRLDFDIPSLIAQQDFETFMHIAAMAQEIEEEEMLLLA